MSDSNGSPLDFAYYSGDNECTDSDDDYICDDVDDCVGEYDECDICNGDGSSCSEADEMSLSVLDSEGEGGAQSSVLINLENNQVVAGLDG